MDSFEFIVKASPRIIDRLVPNQKPLWGKMRPQQMVEHLGLILAISAKKVISRPIPEFTPRRMAYYKAKFFNKEYAIPKNFTPKELRGKEQKWVKKYADLEEAIQAYKRSVRDFEEFFKRDLTALSFFPFFGLLSFDEWTYYHSAHIRHHFIQFGLIGENDYLPCRPLQINR